MVRDARVAVVGGSLGGLTAGLLLRELGLDVTVYERSGAELEQRGAGIGFLPASSRYLVGRGHVVHEQGQAYRFSNWNTVYRSLLRCFGRERYLLGRECAGIRQAAGRVHVTEADGNELDVDLLVCADGVGSRARTCLLPDVTPRYAGYVAWRGLVPARDLGDAAAPFADAITYHVLANSH